MTDRDLLPMVPDDADDADIATRIAALYLTTPQAAPDQVERCVSAVRIGSMHQPVRRPPFGIPAVRWWWGAAAAAVLVTAIMRPWQPNAAETASDSSAVLAALSQSLRGTVTAINGAAVEFDVVLPSTATRVAIVGDFNGWDASASPMVKRAKDGAWSARIPLTPGRHTYAFVVDGERWMVDPLAPQVQGDDGYGPANALVLEAPSS